MTATPLGQSLRVTPTSKAEWTSAIAAVHTHCGIFTERRVAELILDLVGWKPSEDLVANRLLEPACGDGSFLIPAVERLVLSARGRGKLEESWLADSITAFEFEPATAAKARKAVRHILKQAGLDALQAKSLAARWIRCEDFLLADRMSPFSHIVGNPPYMRWSKVPLALRRSYQHKLPSHAARGDLCLAFVCAASDLLSVSGKMAFLCADRWLRCAYGAAARQELEKRFRVAAHFDVHDLQVFTGARNIGTYAGVTLLDRQVGAGSSVAHASSIERLAKLVEATAENSTTKREVGVLAGRASANLAPSNLVSLLERMTGMSRPLPEVGVVVRCGMALGLVEAFAVGEDSLIEPELLVPLIRSRDLRLDGTIATSKHVVNVWTSEGRLVDLFQYPLLREHLQAHKPELEKRVCVVEPAQWYRTIDRLDRARLSEPKILIAGMAKTSRVAWSVGGEQPSNALYALTSKEWPLPMLYALLRAGVLDVFASVLSPKFSGDTKRFDGNILRQVHIPRWSDLNASQRGMLSDMDVKSGRPNAELLAAVYGLKSSEHLRLLRAATARSNDEVVP